MPYLRPSRAVSSLDAQAAAEPACAIRSARFKWNETQAKYCAHRVGTDMASPYCVTNHDYISSW